MGADIHLYVEKRLSNGEWAMVRDLNEVIAMTGLNTAPGKERIDGKGNWAAVGAPTNARIARCTGPAASSHST